jgi:hypothetical protein
VLAFVLLAIPFAGTRDGETVDEAERVVRVDEGDLATRVKGLLWSAEASMR